ncbi:CofC domain containing protein [Nitrosopumilaceae archaeon]|nr:2-phospho-L-lactate guanylyltransferase [Nitrosopumilus sp.]CAI9831230.1 CofC domain containing protein [Nitrosopumilaceae archaeon]MDA7940741.1 2-phospho-L-lactate guanylyltransferase [Nitrosopumilus sp.]MDA7942949.1 2-phospho-L-lactate guanylyltransferase [Nitrosopumilus sp.]MDA7944640.1 2-phospho-L-lactate guanylyltransferase [Nitrosopumilus sp.]
MRTAAIIPVKSFERAKTRLGIGGRRRSELCRLMLAEVLGAAAGSSHIDEVVVVTRDPEAARMGRGAGATVLDDPEEAGVNEAIAIADRHVAGSGLDASIVLPQDIPFMTSDEIAFLMGHAAPPSFVIVVPSRRFDGTNALVRMPGGIMRTHYDEDSYRIHLAEAGKVTPNAALLFSAGMMADIDTMEDITQMPEAGRKPDVARRIREIAGA